MAQKILTIVGARPQFIKASVVSLALADIADIEEIIVHTGQHFDTNMSDIFFSELKIPEPGVRLDIHSGSHGDMTGRMLAEIEKVLFDQKPDRMLVYGDTNSTLAGALAAAKLHIPVAHVEAGLRSFDRNMPEEINRILTDNMADILYCPTKAAIDNLSTEGIGTGHSKATVLNIGDVMEDSTRLFSEAATKPDGFSDENGFVLATIHRAENTDDRVRLAAIVDGLNGLHEKHGVVLPLHPRTRAAIDREGLSLNVRTIDPVGYLEMLWLLKRSDLVVTDSGGLQKEAFFTGKSCITARDSTEWVELIDADVNILVGADKDKLLLEATKRYGQTVENDGSLFGGGTAAKAIASHLQQAG